MEIYIERKTDRMGESYEYIFTIVIRIYETEKNTDLPSCPVLRYDRGNMYKIINGKRNPPGKEFVEKVAGYMHLTPLEKTKLYEAYQISIVGYDIYYRRKAVLEFLTEVDAGRELDFALQPIRAEQGFEMEDKILYAV